MREAGREGEEAGREAGSDGGREKRKERYKVFGAFSSDPCGECVSFQFGIRTPPPCLKASQPPRDPSTWSIPSQHH